MLRGIQGEISIEPIEGSREQTRSLFYYRCRADRDAGIGGRHGGKSSVASVSAFL
jgi:hypothetical protein